MHALHKYEWILSDIRCEDGHYGKLALYHWKHLNMDLVSIKHWSLLLISSF